jgi:C1A family cysteine protease
MRINMSTILLLIIPIATILPSSHSYMHDNIDIYNQGETNMCVAYAVVGAIEESMRIQGHDSGGGFDKAWLYMRARELEGTPHKQGVLVSTAFEIAKDEGLKYSNSDERFKIHDYRKIRTKDIRKELADGNIVVISSKVEKSNWWDHDSLILPSDRQSMYYHAVYLNGYDDNETIGGNTGFYFGVNSWGRSWGDDGRFSMAYDYLHSDRVQSAYVFELYNEDIGLKVGSREMLVGDSIVYLEQPVVLLNGKTVVPLRDVFESLGYGVDWDNGNITIYKK